jgi:hypothetical protein
MSEEPAVSVTRERERELAAGLSHTGWLISSSTILHISYILIGYIAIKVPFEYDVSLLVDDMHMKKKPCRP